MSVAVGPGWTLFTVIPFVRCTGGTDSEAARVHHAAQRCGCGMAALGARAAASDAGCRISERSITRRLRAVSGGVSARLERNRAAQLRPCVFGDQPSRRYSSFFSFDEANPTPAPTIAPITVPSPGTMVPAAPPTSAPEIVRFLSAQALVRSHRPTGFVSSLMLPPH